MRENLLRRYEQKLGVRDPWERRWFWCGFTLLALYTVGVFLAQIAFHVGIRSLRFLVFYTLVALVLCVLAVPVCGRLRLAPAGPEDRRTRKKGLCLAALAFAAALSYFLIWLWIFWPIGYSPDSVDQLDQVLTGVYNNWHPVLHTWLFFTLPIRLVPETWAPVLAHILVFSLAVGYLLYVLYDTGASRQFMALTFLYILANPNTAKILLFPWKDNAMTAFALVLFTQLIRIYAEDGAWLKKKRNLAAFSAAAFLTNAMRHNAVLMVAPVFLILFLFLKKARKPLLVSAASVLAATLLLQGPIFALAKVQAPDQRTVESMGLPMNILANAYVNAPETMGEESLAFMDSLAEPGEIAENYSRGEFNFVKWRIPGISERIDAAGTAKILRCTLDTVRHDPVSALEAVVHLTSQVWGFDGDASYAISLASGNLEEASSQEDTDLRMEFALYGVLCDLFAVRYLFNFTGLIILLLLYLAVSQLGSGNLGRVFMVLSPMAYNFGTMLLLTGSDYRFFHFNFILVVPLLYLILQGRRDRVAVSASIKSGGISQTA